jgi:chromosome segregation ATPase
MAILRKSIGFGFVLLAILGLILCVGGIIGIWLGQGRVDAVNAAVFDTAEEALTFVNSKLHRMKKAVDASRQRISGISRIAKRLHKSEADVKKECEPVLQALEHICQELKSAKSFLDSGQAVASGVSRVSDAVARSDFAASRHESTGVAIALELKQFADAVAEALAKLQGVRSEIIELRDTGKLARDLTVGVLARVADLDGRLERLATRIESLETRVTIAQGTCAALGKRLERWIVFAAVATSAILAWFGASQTVMMAYGWRQMKVRR